MLISEPQALCEPQGPLIIHSADQDKGPLLQILKRGGVGAVQNTILLAACPQSAGHPTSARASETFILRAGKRSKSPTVVTEFRRGAGPPPPKHKNAGLDEANIGFHN